MPSGTNKDYYAALGLLPDADSELIKAAYRALAKKYHPDTSAGDGNSNAQKFLELQEAYDVLGNLEWRRTYDQQRKKSDKLKDSFSSEAHSTDVEIDPDEQWETLVAAHPEMDKLYNEFRQISHALANSFQLSIIGASSPNSYRKIASDLEHHFLSKYFSEHPDLQNLAKRLLLRGRRNAARKLNEAIKSNRPLTKKKRSVIIADFERKYLSLDSQRRKTGRRRKNASPAAPKSTNRRTLLLGSAAVLAVAAVVFVELDITNHSLNPSQQSNKDRGTSPSLTTSPPQQNSSESVHNLLPNSDGTNSSSDGIGGATGEQIVGSRRKLIYERLVTSAEQPSDQNSANAKKAVEAPHLVYEKSTQQSVVSKPVGKRMEPSAGLTLSGGGSAFRVNARRDAVTAYHVVEECEEIILNGKYTSERMKLAQFDAELDLAILQLDGKLAGHPKFARFSSMKNGALGERVIVLGFPLADILGDALRISDGLISSLDSYRSDTTRFQFSAPVQPGNSGGPVLDESGRVIGVASDILDGQRINIPVQNVNFAIKGSVIQDFLRQRNVNIYFKESSGLNTAEIVSIYEDVVLQVSCYASTGPGARDKPE